MSGPESSTADQPVLHPHRAEVHHFPCRGCGAQVEYDPPEDVLTCPYCKHSNQLPKSEKQIRENDYKQQLRLMRHQAPTKRSEEIHCDGCGADVKRPANLAAFRCPFCDRSVVSQPQTADRHIPEAVLPFKVDKEEGRGNFREWVSGLWFAPSALKRAAQLDGGLRGVYMPYWTYDCNTVTFYRGERGEHRYEQQEYIETDSKGKMVKKTREVQVTKWFRTSGVVTNAFDDVLVLASNSLPRDYADKLEPWELEDLRPYEDAYLSGFEAESYQVDLVDSFETAKNVMDTPLRMKVKHDIGGDEQRIHSLNTEYNNITFKYVLLPIWIAAYLYGGKVYRFMINGRTGEVQGERPYSWVKIGSLAAAVVVAILIIIGLVMASS